jgi:hypothetical protein
VFREIPNLPEGNGELHFDHLFFYAKKLCHRT